MYEGHIKLFRKLRKAPYYQDSQYVHLWVHLLLSVNWHHKRLKLDKGDRFIDLIPGQVLTSRDKLSEQTGIHRSKIDRILKAFEREQQIEQQTCSKYRVISILNWSDYQYTEQQSEQEVSNNGASNEQEMSINNKPKKVNKDKKENPSPSADGECYMTKRKRRLAGKRLATFNSFWAAFNYKAGKAEAADAWLDIPTLTDGIVSQIISAAGIEAIARSKLIAEGKTPKMAQGWITGRRWEDEQTVPSAQRGLTDDFEETFYSTGEKA